MLEQQKYSNETIIPRWEWRTFDITKEAAEMIFKNDNCYRTLINEETYILSENTNDNVKLRDGILDMKLPLRIDDNSLELWTVALKASFPLSIHNLALFYKGFGLYLPKLNQNIFSKEEFFSLIQTIQPLHTIKVNKIRHGFRPNGVRSEMAEVKINEKTYYTVSFENESQNKVWELVNKHHLTTKDNVNYIQFLKKHIGLKY